MYVQIIICAVLFVHTLMKIKYMKHLKANLENIQLIKCKYHRTYQSFPDATLTVSIDEIKQEFRIRKRAATRDQLYHSNGLNCTLVVYDGIVLAYEIINSDVSNTEINIENLKPHYNEDWYFDGEKFYCLDARSSSEFLSINEISVIDPIHLTYAKSIEPIVNDAFIICQDNQILLQSPPISASLDKNNKKFLLTDKDQEKMFLSLSALLKMCETVTKIYGGESIEQFDLPQYMIRHKTVNLSKLPPDVRDQSTTMVTPIEAITYMLGLINRQDDIMHIRSIMKVLKVLCRFGIVNVDTNKAENIYKDKPIELKKIVI